MVMVMMTMITVILCHFADSDADVDVDARLQLITYNTHNYHTDADNDEKVSYTKVLITINMMFTPTSPRANASSNQFPSTRALQLVCNFKTCDSNMPLVHTVHTSPQQLQHVNMLQQHTRTTSIWHLYWFSLCFTDLFFTTLGNLAREDFFGRKNP